MHTKDRVCDILGSWESLGESSLSYEKPTLRIRKCIFTRLGTLDGSTAETNFVCDQLLEDIREGRYPLAETDIPFLVGLRAFIETGPKETPK